MRKVVAYELLSLDGVAEQPQEFVTDFDEVMRENLGRVIAAQDAVLLGRRTYDDWAAILADSDIEPFASFINGVEKFVVTSTPPEPQWAETAVVEGSLADFVTDLKRQSGGDIGVHGSISRDPVAARGGPGRRTPTCHRACVHMHGRKLFEKGSAMSAVIDPEHHLSDWVSAARLPG